jgi:hypothetical protein
MYILPASHFKAHAAFEPGRAGEQCVFAVLFSPWRHFSLGGVLFSPVALPFQ